MDDRVYAHGVAVRVAALNAGCVGGIGSIAAVAAALAGYSAVAWAVVVAAVIVLISALMVAVSMGSGRIADIIGGAYVLVYLAKIALIVAALVVVQSLGGIDRQAFLVAVATGIVVSLIADTIAVVTHPVPDYAQVEPIPWEEQAESSPEKGEGDVVVDPL